MQDDVVFDRLIAGQYAIGKAAQVGIAHHLVQISPQRGGQRVADQFGGRLVERDDALLGVDREHSFDHTGKHGLLLVGLTHDGLQTLLQLRRHLVHAPASPVISSESPAASL